MTAPLMICCPNCHRANRLPPERLTGEGTCGACRKPLFNGKPIVANKDVFKRHLGAALPVVVDFWAPWCGPCRQFAPVFEEAARVLEPRVQLLKVNTEEEQLLAGEQGIRSIPTLIIYFRGRELARTAGAMPAGQFLRWVKQIVDGASQ